MLNTSLSNERVVWFFLHEFPFQEQKLFLDYMKTRLLWEKPPSHASIPPHQDFIKLESRYIRVTRNCLCVKFGKTVWFIVQLQRRVCLTYSVWYPKSCTAAIELSYKEWHDVLKVNSMREWNMEGRKQKLTHWLYGQSYQRRCDNKSLWVLLLLWVGWELTDLLTRKCSQFLDLFAKASKHRYRVGLCQ